MNTAFNKYLKDIDLSDILINRVDDLITEIENLYILSITDIFVCNKETKEGITTTSLWAFSNNWMIECKNFALEEDFDILSVKDSVVYCNIKKNNYKIREAPNSNSSLYFFAMLNVADMTCEFSAIGINCRYLLEIVKSYFFNNIQGLIYGN